MKKSSQILYTVITGATSGIGHAIAKELAAKGHGLILLGRRSDRISEVEKECLKLGSPNVLTAMVDLTQTAQIKKICQELIKNKIAIKNIINSAGLASGVDLYQDSKTEDVDLMIDTNIKGLFHLTRELVSAVVESKGHIVNLGSVAGRLVYEGGAVYCATKFAVRAFSEGLRMDLKGSGVRITNIEPGMAQTEFSLVRLGNQQKADKVYEGMMPLSASDIANSILWCLEQPPHVNIQELVIYPTDQASVGQVVRGEKSIKNLKV